MTSVKLIPTRKAETDESVLEQFEKLKAYIESGNVSGLAVSLIFRDGRSLTFASKSDNRREMSGAILDLLLDYASNR